MHLSLHADMLANQVQRLGLPRAGLERLGNLFVCIALTATYPKAIHTASAELISSLWIDVKDRASYL